MKKLTKQAQRQTVFDQVKANMDGMKELSHYDAQEECYGNPKYIKRNELGQSAETEMYYNTLVALMYRAFELAPLSKVGDQDRLIISQMLPNAITVYAKHRHDEAQAHFMQCHPEWYDLNEDEDTNAMLKHTQKYFSNKADDLEKRIMNTFKQICLIS